MHSVRTLALLAALLLAPAAARAAPPSRPVPRPALEVRASIQKVQRGEPLASGDHALRDLPAPLERPGVYALVTHWVEKVALPGPDGKPKLVLVMVRGRVGLAWARRW